MGSDQPNSDVLVLRLSRYHRLDLVRLRQARRYRIVFAERWGVQRRAFVEVSYEDALAVARFLADIDSALGDPEEPTEPERPLAQPPQEVKETAERDPGE
jgi:hypothetical protein